eukprot:195462_1
MRVCCLGNPFHSERSVRSMSTQPGVVRSAMPDVRLPTESLPAFVFKDLEQKADRLAVICERTGERLTYGELHARIVRVANGLLRRGFEVGDRVIMWMADSIEHLVVFHAVGYLGGATVNLIPWSSVVMGAFHIEETRPRYIFTSAELMGNVVEAAGSCKSLQNIFVCEGEAQKTGIVRSFSELLEGEDTQLPKVEFDVNTTVVTIPFSSGSTGQPKGVMLTHAGMTVGALQFEAVIPHDTEHVLGGLFFYVSGIAFTLCVNLHLGLTTIIFPKLDHLVRLSLLEKYNIHFGFIHSAHMAAMATDPEALKYKVDLSTIITGGAHLSNEVATKFTERFKCKVINGYGMTESGGIISATPLGSKNYESVGPVCPNSSFKIVKEDNTACKVLEHGHLLLKGPQMMKGYLKPKNKPTAFVDGWLLTGDMAYFDENNWIYIAGRRSELIVKHASDGAIVNISPTSIESVIYKLEAVKETAVIAVISPETHTYECLKAFVVRKDGAELSEREVMYIVAQKLPQHSHLDFVEFLDELPRTESGKLARKLLTMREECTGEEE